MSELKNSIAKFDKFKYPLLVLALGLVLLMLPTGGEKSSPVKDSDTLLQSVLSCSDGVGEAKVIISDKGVVVVCSGADNADVRLDIIRAIGSYTGFASDKITVLKMAE